jgi:uncharacterized membrane protein YhhN
VFRGVEGGSTLVGFVAVIAPALAIKRWLEPHMVGSRLRKPVLLYLVAISSMVALCVATVVSYGRLKLLVAAVLFLLSDVLVAREKFVVSSYRNRLAGLTMYYVAQLMFATG